MQRRWWTLAHCIGGGQLLLCCTVAEPRSLPCPVPRARVPHRVRQPSARPVRANAQRRALRVPARNERRPLRGGGRGCGKVRDNCPTTTIFAAFLASRQSFFYIRTVDYKWNP